MLETVVIIVHLLMALALVVLILLQQGKGADAGASFGSGASGTVFGSQGSATFLSRLTAILASVFFVTSLGLAFFAKQKADTLGQVGLPSAAAIESRSNVTQDDIPVLHEQNEEATPASDIPEVPAE